MAKEAAPRVHHGRVLLVCSVGIILTHLLSNWGLPTGSIAAVGFTSGIAFALLLVIGPAAIPAVAVSLALALWIQPRPEIVGPWATMRVALVYSAGYGVSAALARRRIGPERWFAGARPTALFVLAAALSPALIMAAGELLMRPQMVPNPRIMGINVPASLLIHWARDVAGLLSAGPLVMVWLARPIAGWVRASPAGTEYGRPGRAQLFEALTGGLGAAGVLWLAVVAYGATSLHLYFIAFLPILFVVARSGVRTTSISLAVFAICSARLWSGLGWASALAAGDLRMLLASMSAASMLLAAFVDERREAREKLRQSAAQYRALAARTETVREEERTRLAREIHDELGQSLTAVKIGLAMLERSGGGGAKPLQAEEIQRLSSYVDDTIATVRRVASDLRPGALDKLGLDAAVEWLAQEFSGRTGIACRLAQLDRFASDPDRDTALFRMLQESLTNVARHARANQVEIRLARAGGCAVLTVDDDGCGIAEAAVSAPGSLGLLGMRERALQLGGTLTVARRPDGGTRIRAEIPLDSAAL